MCVLKKWSTLLILLWILGQEGLAQGQVSADEAKVTIFQKGAFSNSLFDMYINGQLAAKDFQPRTYFTIRVPTGEFVVRTTGKPAFAVEEKTTRIFLHPGREYYLEAVLVYDPFSRALFVVPRMEEDFKRRIKSLRLDEKAKTKLD